MSWVSNSYEDAYAILRNRLKSLFVFLPAPSAILELIETLHLRS
jgi:hypothetical protein